MAEDKELAGISDKTVEERLKNFSDLLKNINDVDDKKKKLWQEIYENAISDRQNAFLMFRTLVNIAESKSTEHAVHGKTMATYIERMSKANEQLIKLAELIARAEQGDEPIDPDEVFNKIRARSK